MLQRKALFTVLVMATTPYAGAANTNTLNVAVQLGDRGGGCRPGDCYNGSYTGTEPNSAGIGEIGSKYATDTSYTSLGAIASARGGAGNIGVYATSSVNVSDFEIGNFVAAASASARSQDVITIQADPESGLAIGSVVRVRLQAFSSYATYSGGINEDGVPDGRGAGSYSQFKSFVDYSWSGLGQSGVAGFSICSDDGGNFGGGCGSATVVPAVGLYIFDETVMLTVGQQLYITAGLFAQTEAGAYWASPPIAGLGGVATAGSDAFNSQHNYLTSLTPGVVFVADSGHDYTFTSPVPEPSTFALFLCSLAVLPFARRRAGSGRLMIEATNRRCHSPAS